MSTHVISHRKDPLELIERLLNNTTLSTKRVTHRNIVDVGENVRGQLNVDLEGEKSKAVQEALEAAEQRHTRELKAALRRLKHELREEQKKALERQKWFFEDLAKRVARQRDLAEEERIRELKRQFEMAKDDALKEQWEECERLKMIAIEEACAALRKQLRNDFVLEKEQAVANALAKAREQFKIREKAAIERTRQECQKEAAEEAARVARQHAAELRKKQQEYDILHQKYLKEKDHKERVELDFKELQDDYRRFMDYTDGKYHSDYMMRLRSHGMKIAQKKVSVVTYEDIERLK